MDRYYINIFTPCLLLIKYVSFTTSPINKNKFGHSLKQKILEKNSQLRLDVEERLSKHHGHRSKAAATYNWALLMRPRKLLNAIEKYHLTDSRFFFAMVTQWVMLLYLIIKCLFHIYNTGVDDERARYYDRQYYFPRLFESHGRPDLFYGHTLVIVIYMISVRSISFYRLIKMSILNEQRYDKVSITAINFSYLSYIYLPPRDWIKLLVESLRHHFGFLHNRSKLKEHLRMVPSKLDASELRHHDLIYRENQIDFENCYKTGFPSLYRVDRKISSKIRNKSCFKDWHTTWPIHRMDFCDLGLLAVSYGIVLVSLVSGIFAVFFCSVYFELDGAIREKYKTEWSFVDTINYLPIWLEEPRRLIRLNDLMILTCVQLPNQWDAAVYYADVLVLISRAYKVLLCLEQDRIVCNTYMGGNGSHERGGIVLDTRKEFELSHKEEANLNKRIVERIRLTQVLKAEFKDLKEYHTLYLNIVIFFGGLSIAYCISLIILSVSFSTVVAIGLNAVASIGPMVYCMILSAILNNMFKGINKSLHLLVVNERSYLTTQTVRYLMIESEIFDSARERSIQIAGAFSITPESLGPLVAYISTCILILTNKFKTA